MIYSWHNAISLIILFVEDTTVGPLGINCVYQNDFDNMNFITESAVMTCTEDTGARE